MEIESSTPREVSGCAAKCGHSSASLAIAEVTRRLRVMIKNKYGPLRTKKKDTNLLQC